MSFFREELQRRRADRLHGSVIVDGRVGWLMIVVTIILALAAVIVILGVATYSESGSAVGVLRQGGGVVSVVAPRDGTLTEVLVGSGDLVSKGRELAVVTNNDFDASGADLGKAAEGLLAEEAAVILMRRQAVTGLYRARIDAMHAQIAEVEAKRLSHTQRAETVARLLATAREDFTNAQKIAERGFVSQQDLLRREERLLQRKEEAATIEGEEAAASARIAQFEAELRALEMELLSQKSDLLARQAELGRAKIDNDLARGYVLKAPNSGRVSNLDLKVGDHVRANETLMILGASENALSAELKLDERLASLTDVGQACQIEFVAFPAQKYGLLKGTITYLSAVPDSESDTPMRPTYVAHVRFNHTERPPGLVGVELMEGMGVTGHIAIEPPSFLDRLLNPRGWFQSS